VERCSAFSKIEPEDRYLNFAVHERKFLHPTSPAVLKKIIADMADSGFRPIPRGRVEFRGVTARYPSKDLPALQDLNLQVAPGEKVGIVGRTGAGKTSLIKLFWMCLEPSQGKVYIDGRDVMRLDLKTLRASMDIISQDTAIFEGTLRENLDPKLEYLHDKSSPEFKEKDRQLLEKVVSMGFTAEDLEDKGLDYPISSGGSNLSLGQKQLLSFIRILIDPKKLMILDEATANIDLKTERLMQDAVKNEFKGNTMFIIAHRIQTVLDCDKICVMEAGRIVEYGTPKDLLAAENSRFAEIFKKLQENNDES
jgi:ABC-type multidrug transport system fused ATPase/permease subunit